MCEWCGEVGGTTAADGAGPGPGPGPAPARVRAPARRRQQPLERQRETSAARWLCFVRSALALLRLRLWLQDPLLPAAAASRAPVRPRPAPRGPASRVAAFLLALRLVPPLPPRYW